MNTIPRFSKVLFALACLIVPAGARAQLNSNPAQVQLVAEPFPESLTLDAGPAVVNFLLSSHAVSDGDQPIIVRVNHVLDPNSGSRTVSVYFYFTQSEALSTAGSSIPSDRVLGSIGGLPYQPFQSSTPFSGPTGLELATSATGSGAFQTDLSLRIDAIGLPLVPVTYSGTLFVQVQAL